MVEGGFDLSWAWGIGLICFAFGLVAGIAGSYLISRKQQRVEELASQLSSAQQQLDGYREQVGQHFLKTSDLVQKMTSSYRDIYEHLANGSQTLCADPVSTPQLDIPHQPMLSQENDSETAKQNEEATGNDFSDAGTEQPQEPDADSYIHDSPNTPGLGNETRH